MSLFKDLKNATYAKHGNYLDGGTVHGSGYEYTLELVKFETGKTFAGDEHFIGTYRVIDTSSPRHKPGDEVNIYCANYGKAKANFLGNVKKQMVAIYSTMAKSPVDPAEIGETEANLLMEPGKKAGALPGTHAEGTRVKARTKLTLTKNKTDFTVVDLDPVW